jgi:hypothetical protein
VKFYETYKIGPRGCGAVGTCGGRGTRRITDVQRGTQNKKGAESIVIRSDCVGDLAQVFMMLAYLAIGLISIIVPTYAISVSYLARETAKTFELIEKRREELQEKLEEFKLKLKKSPETEDLKKEIKNYEEKIEELKTNLSFLSVRGAVGYPLLFFLVALTFAILGVYSFPTPESSGMVITIVFMSFGLACVGRTLRGVERAALRIPSPKFEVGFKSGATIEKFKTGEQREVPFKITNVGEELAENTRLTLLFPPDFNVIKSRDYEIIKQTDAPYSEYNSVDFYVSPPVYVYVDDSYDFEVSIKMPEKTGRYIIPIQIHARNMRKSEHQLTIEVISKSGS